MKQRVDFSHRWPSRSFEDKIRWRIHKQSPFCSRSVASALKREEELPGGTGSTPHLVWCYFAEAAAVSSTKNVRMVCDAGARELEKVSVVIFSDKNPLPFITPVRGYPASLATISIFRAEEV
jgi:hypothetical protein